MSIDYVSIAAIAKTLVDGAGRDVTFRQLDTTVADPTKPWRGPANPRSTPLSTLVLKAAFVPLSSSSVLGLSKQAIDLAKKADETCLVGSTLDLVPYQELTDSRDGRTYKITHIEVLAPGSLTLLSFLVLNQ